MGQADSHGNDRGNDRGIELVRYLLKGTMVRNKHGVGGLFFERWLF
jgi:hypothetical protein